jgi:hypothetical protein
VARCVLPHSSHGFSYQRIRRGSSQERKMSMLLGKYSVTEQEEEEKVDFTQ